MGVNSLPSFHHKNGFLSTKPLYFPKAVHYSVFSHRFPIDSPKSYKEYISSNESDNDLKNFPIRVFENLLFTL